MSAYALDLLREAVTTVFQPSMNHLLVRRATREY
jgi:hypothetical protein